MVSGWMFYFIFKHQMPNIVIFRFSFIPLFEFSFAILCFYAMFCVVVVLFVFVSCTQSYLRLWVVHPSYPLRSSLRFYIEHCWTYCFILKYVNCIGCVMVSVLASSAVDRGFEPRSGQTKDNKIGMCCFSAKRAALRRKEKDWLARNQDNVSEYLDMSICGLLFQWDSTIKIRLSVLV